MIDKELLEAAAKETGITAPWSDRAHAYRWSEGSEWIEWNPLANDGDAFRLAVKLGMFVAVFYESDRMKAHVVANRPYPYEDVSETFSGDPYAATRRAIVRAAAQGVKEKTE